MAVYCDPCMGPREWHETETWHTAEDEKIDRLALAEALHTHRTTSRFSVEEQFEVLVNEWKAATENLSSMTRILSHPAYQRIIHLGLQDGARVVSLILDDFRKDGAYWSTALQAITGQNAVNPKHIGNMKKIREDWLKWGKAQGYL